jgi:hypothetical protein
VNNLIDDEQLGREFIKIDDEQLGREILNGI